MKEIISKELLSAVIGIEVIRLDDGKYQYPNNDMSKIYYLINGTYGVYSSINIYELAHKCKQWAWNNRFKVSSCINDEYEDGFLYLSSMSGTFLLPKYTKVMKYFEADTEAEAIFKACQWILDNKGVSNGRA